MTGRDELGRIVRRQDLVRGHYVHRIGARPRTRIGGMTFGRHEWLLETRRGVRWPRTAHVWYASRQRKRDVIRKFHDEVDACVARRIRLARVLRGMRQTDLADAVGISAATVSRIETNRRPARPGELLRFAIQLGCTVEDFFIPPEPWTKTGWEHRPIETIHDRAFDELARSGALPWEHPAYD